MQQVLRTTTSASETSSTRSIPSAERIEAMPSESCSFIWHPKVRTTNFLASLTRASLRDARRSPWRRAGLPSAAGGRRYLSGVLIGAHVSSAGGPLRALERGEAMGAEAVQLHTQSPRVWRPTGLRDDDLARARERLAASPVVRVAACHGSYLVNLATADRVLLDRSRGALAENLRVTTQIGAAGLVLHLGSHLGSGFESCLRQVARELVRALDAAD